MPVGRVYLDPEQEPVCVRSSQLPIEAIPAVNSRMGHNYGT